MKKIYKGNAAKLSREKGWFFGHFMKIPELKRKDFEVQFVKLRKGQKKPAPTYNKEGKTLTILIDGEVCEIFPKNSKKFILKKPGDFVFFQNKITHMWKANKKSTIITFRLPSIEGDSVEVKL